jgi:hypothetical protein
VKFLKMSHNKFTFNRHQNGFWNHAMGLEYKHHGIHEFYNTSTPIQIISWVQRK